MPLGLGCEKASIIPEELWTVSISNQRGPFWRYYDHLWRLHPLLLQWFGRMPMLMKTCPHQFSRRCQSRSVVRSVYRKPLHCKSTSLFIDISRQVVTSDQYYYTNTIFENVNLWKPIQEYWQTLSHGDTQKQIRIGVKCQYILFHPLWYPCLFLSQQGLVLFCT